MQRRAGSAWGGAASLSHISHTSAYVDGMATTAGQPSRRRQRSARVVTAVVLVVLGALTVVAGVVTGSWTALVLAAIVAVVAGAAATRITHSELADTRRAAARDRAVLARDYHDLQVLRGAEHELFAESMQARLADQQTRINKLAQSLAEHRTQLVEAREQLAAAIRRAESAEGEGARVGKLLEDARARAAHAEMRVVELEQQLEEIAVSWPVSDGVRKRA